MAIEQRKLQSLRQQGTLNPRPQAVTDARFQGSDFFDPKDTVQVKYEMLRRVRVEKASVSESAKFFGLSRPSYYQANSAFTEGGLAGLLPQKRGPRRAHKLDAKVMEFLDKSRHGQPLLTSLELAAMVRKEFGIRVHRRSVERALSRHQKKQH